MSTGRTGQQQKRVDQNRCKVLSVVILVLRFHVLLSPVMQQLVECPHGTVKSVLYIFILNVYDPGGHLTIKLTHLYFLLFYFGGSEG